MPLLTTETETYTLTADEAKALAGYLKLNRNPETWANWFCSTLNFHIGKHNEEPLTPQLVSYALFDAVDQATGDEVQGLFVDPSGTLHALTGDKTTGEAHELAQYLILTRSNYWLAAFARVELSLYAEGRRRTPAQVVKNLEEYIENFAFDVADANAMIQNHPDLLTMPKAEPAVSEIIPERATAAEPEEEPAPSPQVAPEKPSRKAPKAAKPRNRTTSISRSRKGKEAA